MPGPGEPDSGARRTATAELMGCADSARVVDVAPRGLGAEGSGSSERGVVLAAGRRRAVAPRAGAEEAIGERRAIGREGALGELPPEPFRDRLQDAAQERRRRRAQVPLAPLRRLLVEVVGELALERPPNLLAVRTELPQRLLDLRGEHRLREVRVGAEDGAADALEHPLRAAEEQECGAARRPQDLRRLAPQ